MYIKMYRFTEVYQFFIHAPTAQGSACMTLEPQHKPYQVGSQLLHCRNCKKLQKYVLSCDSAKWYKRVEPTARNTAENRIFHYCCCRIAVL